MRRTKTTYWGLLCLAVFIVYLKLSKRRRAKRIDLLEQALGYKPFDFEKRAPTITAMASRYGIDPFAFMEQLKREREEKAVANPYSTYLYGLQSAVQEVFPTQSEVFQVKPGQPNPRYVAPAAVLSYGGPMSDEQWDRLNRTPWKNYVKAERTVRA